MIERARRGEVDALGILLEQHRHDLRGAARALVGHALRAKVDPSDLVQETFLKANRDFASFEGRDEAELRAWLRTILVRCLADQVRHHKRRVRAYQRQVSLDALLLGSRSAVQRSLAARGPSPSEGAVRREQTVMLADAVDRLPEDYRKVYQLRTLQHLSFEDIAPRMNRSVGAVRMLWARALERLNSILEGRL
jgi:RNA polymerase sigma-70 factor (ECF subfamily)